MPAPPDDFDAAFPNLAALAYRVAFRLLGDRAEAEDVAQEALARAFVRWRRVHEFPEAWVVRVATNLTLDRLRRRQRSAALRASGRPAPFAPSVGSLVPERLDLARQLAGLPRRQREVVALRYLADLSEADVARTLSCSTGSVKRHAHRGLAALRSLHVEGAS